MQPKNWLAWKSCEIKIGGQEMQYVYLYLIKHSTAHSLHLYYSLSSNNAHRLFETHETVAYPVVYHWWAMSRDCNMQIYTKLKKLDSF